MNKIWVYIDQFKGQALPTSWEGIGAGKTLAGQLGGGVTACIFGKGVEGIASQAFQPRHRTANAVPAMSCLRPKVSHCAAPATNRNRKG